MSATNAFPPTSRYYGFDTRTYTAPDGSSYTYLSRRFVPQPERFALIRTYTVTQGERLDNMTARFLGDPEAFWRICDANAALRPEELEEMGRQLRITLPEGVPGTPHA